MYIGKVIFTIKSGKLDQAVAFWLETILPQAKRQAGYKGSLLMKDPVKNSMVGMGFWETKADADAFEKTAFYKEIGTALKDILEAEPRRQEYELSHIDISPVSLFDHPYSI